MDWMSAYFAFFFLHRRQLKSLLAEVEGIEDLAMVILSIKKNFQLLSGSIWRNIFNLATIVCFNIRNDVLLCVSHALI